MTVYVVLWTVGCAAALVFNYSAGRLSDIRDDD